MEELDVSDGFDMHDYRHGLKLIQENRRTKQLENRANEFACPACGKAFDRLFVTEKRENTFGDPGSPFCIVRAGEQVLLLTH
jgi:transposase